MITTCTELEAKQKKCPRIMVQDNCIGCQCMAWQWIKPANLQKTTCIPLGFGVEEPAEKPTKENLRKPDGEGWRLDADEPPYFSEDDDGSCWVIYWERSTDPEREGYCADLNHPLALQVELENIRQTLYDLKDGD